MINQTQFNRDLEVFEISIKKELESGLDEIKKVLGQQEYKLRSDLHSAVGGFVSFMRSKYGNGVAK